jgi:hypothetical protein
MKIIHTAQQLLKSMAAHGDTKRFITECTRQAHTIEETPYKDSDSAFIFHFPDASRVEFDPSDKYIRAYSPSQHLD